MLICTICKQEIKDDQTTTCIAKWYEETGTMENVLVHKECAELYEEKQEDK